METSFHLSTIVTANGEEGGELEGIFHSLEK